MRHVSGRATRVGRETRGNVIWLTYPAGDRNRRSPDTADSLKKSVAALAREIERSERLKTDIAAAVGARRYELYRGSAISGAGAAHGTLARAQGIHLSSLLQFVHGIAAAGSHQRADARGPVAEPDHLTVSIRELKASLRRAQQLSRDLLRDSQRRDWREGAPRPEDSAR